jgi:DNA-binding protein H-NS
MYLLVVTKRKNQMARSTSTSSANGAATPDFSKYAFTDLVEIKKELDKEIQSRQAREVEELRARVAESAHALGVSIEELFGLRRHAGTRITKHPRGKQPAKYRGPNGEEWSGKGPAPRWMKPYLAKGKTKADFLISSKT